MDEDEDDLNDGLEFILLNDDGSEFLLPDDECDCPMLPGGFIKHVKSCPYMINKYGL